MALLGAVLVRLSVTDVYLRYVTSWMKWPILISGALLLVLAAGLVLGERKDGVGPAAQPDAGGGGHGHDHGTLPLVAWLLVLPGLVTFVISPPQLGSYLAERRSGESQTVAEPDSLTDLAASEVVPVDVTEFIWRAQDGGATLEDQQVELTGFVSYDKDRHWYVTRMVIGCCAADAIAYQVRVDGDHERPPRDQWVSVTGVYTPGTGSDGRTPPQIEATEVREADAPDQTYE